MEWSIYKLITIGTDPIIFTVGSFQVGWHGIFMALAFVAGIYIPYVFAPKAGVSQDDILTTAIWVVPGAIIGARLIHILDNLNYYITHPSAIIGFEGLALYGGILGGSLAAIICISINRYPLAKITDITAPGVILGQAIGRIGCIINGDAAGMLTNQPWGFIYTNPAAYAPLNVSTHPSPLYELIWDLLIFAGLLKLRNRIKPDGMLFVIYMMAYSAGRFFISFTRDETAVIGTLHQSQIISLALFVIGFIVLGRLKKWPLFARISPEKTETAEEPEEVIEKIVPPSPEASPDRDSKGNDVSQ